MCPSSLRLSAHHAAHARTRFLSAAALLPMFAVCVPRACERVCGVKCCALAVPTNDTLAHMSCLHAAALCRNLVGRLSVALFFVDDPLAIQFEFSTITFLMIKMGARSSRTYRKVDAAAVPITSGERGI